MKPGIVSRLLSLGLRFVLWGAVGAMTFVALHLLVGVTYALGAGHTVQANHDVAVIFGNRVYRDGTPSRRLGKRLERGLSLYRVGTVRRIVVTGGVDSDGVNEAAGMARWLEERGVAQADLIRDPLGNTTYLSLINYQRLAEEHRFRSAVMVSQYYHLPRIRLLAWRMGLRNIGVAAAPYFFEWREFYSLLREVPAFYYYLWRKIPGDKPGPAQPVRAT